MNKSYPDSDKLEPETEDPQMPLKWTFSWREQQAKEMLCFFVFIGCYSS